MLQPILMMIPEKGDISNEIVANCNLLRSNFAKVRKVCDKVSCYPHGQEV